MTRANMQSALVTGGAGFLGSHLCAYLLEKGYRVLCVDNFHTGNRQNVASLMGHPRFELLSHDVTVPLHAEVDEIYNLACPASPVHYQSDPIRTTRTNVLGALNMLELAHRVNATILQASTSEVYGDPKINPQAETYWGHVNPVGIRSCYDEGKRCAETLFMDYRRQHNVRVKIARIFNTYGPQMQPTDGRVVSNFIIQALANAPLTVYGDGRQTRSFCYVDDLVEGLYRLMQAPADFCGPVNLGNPVEHTMLELAGIVIDVCESHSPVVFRPLPPDDPTQRRPDISCARTALAWNPEVGLREGLVRTVRYFRQLQSPGTVPARPARRNATCKLA